MRGCYSGNKRFIQFILLFGTYRGWKIITGRAPAMQDTAGLGKRATLTELFLVSPATSTYYVNTIFSLCTQFIDTILFVFFFWRQEKKIRKRKKSVIRRVCRCVQLLGVAILQDVLRRDESDKDRSFRDFKGGALGVRCVPTNRLQLITNTYLHPRNFFKDVCILQTTTYIYQNIQVAVAFDWPLFFSI